jgi:hypothetical protein
MCFLDGKPENKLGPTAVKFLQRLRNMPDRTMDLNQASQELGVPKRRIYDITNVLEGLGTVIKTDKNTVRYGTAKTSYIASPELRTVTDAVDHLDAELARLEAEIDQANKSIQKYTDRGIYLLREDVETYVSHGSGSTIIIHTPIGTRLEADLPDPSTDPAQHSTRRLRLTNVKHSMRHLVLSHHPLDRMRGIEIPHIEQQQQIPPPSQLTVDYSATSYLSGGDTTPSRSTFSTPTRYHHSSLELSLSPQTYERYPPGFIEPSPAQQSLLPSPLINRSHFDLNSPVYPRYPQLSSPLQFATSMPFEHEEEWKDPEPPPFRSLLFKDWSGS